MKLNIFKLKKNTELIKIIFKGKLAVATMLEWDWKNHDVWCTK